MVSECKPLSYRRVSDLLVELENSGLVVSRAYSRGRHGYGKEYKLKVSPDLVGSAVNQEWFDGIIRKRKSRDLAKKLEKTMKSSRSGLFNRYTKLLSGI
jgi:cell division control protein 6